MSIFWVAVMAVSQAFGSSMPGKNTPVPLPAPDPDAAVKCHKEVDPIIKKILASPSVEFQEYGKGISTYCDSTSLNEGRAQNIAHCAEVFLRSEYTTRIGLEPTVGAEYVCHGVVDSFEFRDTDYPVSACVQRIVNGVQVNAAEAITFCAGSRSNRENVSPILECARDLIARAKKEKVATSLSKLGADDTLQVCRFPQNRRQFLIDRLPHCVAEATSQLKKALFTAAQENWALTGCLAKLSNGQTSSKEMNEYVACLRAAPAEIIWNEGLTGCVSDAKKTMETFSCIRSAEKLFSIASSPVYVKHTASKRNFQVMSALFQFCSSRSVPVQTPVLESCFGQVTSTLEMLMPLARRLEQDARELQSMPPQNVNRLDAEKRAQLIYDFTRITRDLPLLPEASPSPYGYVRYSLETLSAPTPMTPLYLCSESQFSKQGLQECLRQEMDQIETSSGADLDKLLAKGQVAHCLAAAAAQAVPQPPAGKPCP